VNPIPGHLHTVTPRLVVRDGAAAIDFCRRAFGGRSWVTGHVRPADPGAVKFAAVERSAYRVQPRASEAPQRDHARVSAESYRLGVADSRSADLSVARRSSIPAWFL